MNEEKIEFNVRRNVQEIQEVIDKTGADGFGVDGMRSFSKRNSLAHHIQKCKAL